MMKTLEKFFLIALTCIGLVTLQACDTNEGPLEETGENIDNAVDDAGDAIDDAADDAEDAIDDAAN